MIDKDFYRQLVEALEDPEIQGRIRTVILGEAPEMTAESWTADERGETAWPSERTRMAALREQLEEQERENGELRGELRRCESERAMAQEEAARLEQERAGLESALGDMERTARDRERTLQELENHTRDLERDLRPYRELNDLWQRFQALSGEAGDEVKKFLPWEDPMRFFAVGCQRETIFRLWDVLCRQCQQREDSGEEILLEVLAFLVKCYNFNYSAPALELMTGETGQPFDKERHLRSPSCSLYQGQVERVLLPGIWNRNKGCAERKCLVRF